MPRKPIKLAAQVKAFADKAKERQLVVFKISAERVLREANVPVHHGGRLPFDLGNLRNSITAGTSPGGGEDPALVFHRLEIGQTAYAGWSAVYAMRQEFGFHGPDSLGRVYNYEGRAFLRSSIQRWQEYVDDAVGDAKRAVE